MKQIIINVPDNCELKQDSNTYTIVEKEKKLTYEDIARELFSKPSYYINAVGSIVDANSLINHSSDLNNCTSKKQAKKLLAINKLMNVAKYLNGDWHPHWEIIERKWYIFLNVVYKKIEICYETKVQNCTIYFKSEELAQQAIEILGEDTIRLALCSDY